MDRLKERANRYILYFVFFFLAGGFQWLGNSTKGAVSNLFFVLSSAIFFALILFWSFSLQRRMPNRRSRYLLSSVALLLLSFLVVRFVKYFLVTDPTVSRYLWYYYYVPELFVPTLCLLLVAVTRRRKLVGGIFLSLSASLSLLVFTNDLHQWAFEFEGDETLGNLYVRGPLFYVVIAYVSLLLLASILLLAYRCKKQGGRKLFFLPFLVLFLCMGMDVLFFVLDLPMFKIPELLCFTFLCLFESCVLVSLFPSNDHHREFFLSSNSPALIIDEGKTLIAKSKGALLPSLLEREACLSHELYLEGDIRLRSAKINGGWVLLEEDFSSLRRLERTLLTNKEELLGEQDLLLYENEVKGKEASIKERKEVFKTINSLGRTLLPDIMLCLLKAREGNYSKHVNEALLRLAYLKRKANLLLREEGRLPLEELSLSIKESLHYLSCLSSFRLQGKGEVAKGTMLQIYEDFELIIESLPEDASFLLNVKKEGKEVSMRFFFASPAPLPPLLKGKKKEKRNEEGHLVELTYQEGKA